MKASSSKMLRISVAALISIGAAMLILVAVRMLPVTLASRIDSDARKFEPGATRAAVEKWAATQPAKSGTFWKIEDGIGNDKVISLAGLSAGAVGYTVRVDYAEQQHFSEKLVSLYFFFDENDQLIRHLVTERELSL